MAITQEQEDDIKRLYRTAIELGVAETKSWGKLLECDLVDYILALELVPQDNRLVHKLGHIFIAIGIAIGAQYEVH